jgi:hypothetical protein
MSAVVREASCAWKKFNQEADGYIVLSASPQITGCGSRHMSHRQWPHTASKRRNYATRKRCVATAPASIRSTVHNPVSSGRCIRCDIQPDAASWRWQVATPRARGTNQTGNLACFRSITCSIGRARKARLSPRARYGDKVRPPNATPRQAAGEEFPSSRSRAVDCSSVAMASRACEPPMDSAETEIRQALSTKGAHEQLLQQYCQCIAMT